LSLDVHHHQRVYGRRKELIKAVKLINEFRLGPSHFLMIHGNAGVGKSAIVNKITSYFGCPLFVCEGKCTREDKSPYSSVQMAFRTAWKRQLPFIPEEMKLVWRNRVSYQFDDAGLAALVTLIPEFAEFLGRSAVRSILCHVLYCSLLFSSLLCSFSLSHCHISLEGVIKTCVQHQR